MKILRNTEIPLEKWNTLISSNQYASPFQTHAFFDLFNSVPGLSSEAFAVEVKSEIKALCVVTQQKEPGIKSFFTRRAIIYGGPILVNNDTISLEFLLTIISKEFKGKTIYTEIRNLNDYSTFNSVFKSNKWQYLPYQNYYIDCTDKEILFNRLGNNRKRQIKKAIISGIKIREARNITEISEFYSMLQRLYTQKIKKPLLPKTFFEEFFFKTLGKYLLVIYNDKIIGGIMCPILEGRCIYEFYVCGLDEDYKEQYPSVMATWAAIEYALQNNIKLFDFMGAGKPNENYGVRDFKARFGGEQVEYGRFLKVQKPFLYKIGKIGIKILSRL